MTICGMIKVRKPSGELIILAGSDSEVSTTSHRLHSIENKNKLLKIKDSIIAVSGGGSISEAVEDLLEDKNFLDSIDLCTKKGVRLLGEQIYELFKLMAERSPIPDIASSAGDLLIATPNNIYKMFPDLAIYSFDDFCSSGIGEESFNGAMTILLEDLKSDPEITNRKVEMVMTRAIDTACTHVLHCNPPIHLAYPDSSCTPIRPKTRKKRNG